MSKPLYSLNLWSNKEILYHLMDEIGSPKVYSQKNYDYVANLTAWLTTAPRNTIYRFNPFLCKKEQVLEVINTQLSKLAIEHGNQNPMVFVHPILEEIIVMENWNDSSLKSHQKEVIVDIACGAAVLRGSHVFAPGVKGMCSDVEPGDFVSVYADIENKCTRGLIKPFLESKYFIGNGIVKIGRKHLFADNSKIKGVAVEMRDVRSGVPSLPINCIPDSFALLQNLPSILTCKALNPQPGERILDMCAAPGNKTTLLATLMNDNGSIAAIDRTIAKVNAIRERCQKLNINSVRCFVNDSTKIVAKMKNFGDKTPHSQQKIEGELEFIRSEDGGPPFCCESFDRILLDAPCSALGQRPQLINSITLKQLKSYPPLQRKLFEVAVALLKTGGHLIYSTCTVTVSENEHIVKWALEKFSCLHLIQVEPIFGGNGFQNVGLTKEQEQLVRRFGPPVDNIESYFNNYDYNNDTVGFFIACFVKK